MFSKTVRIATVILVHKAVMVDFIIKISFQNFRMVFATALTKLSFMSSGSSSSSSNTLLLVLVLIITFPFWIAVGGILIGVLAGVFGALFGVIAALFGILVGIVLLPLKLLFGWGDGAWHGHHWPHFHSNGFITLSIIIIFVFVIHSRLKK